MKVNLSLILLLYWMGMVVTQAAQQQVVAPNALANVEGNSSTSDPFTSSSFRFQQVFDASQFAFLGGSNARIDGISFRIDVASSQDVGFSFAGSTIRLSTTSRSPDGLSTVFADNVGVDVVATFNGGFGLCGLYQPGAAPQPFNQSPILELLLRSFTYLHTAICYWTSEVLEGRSLSQAL